MRKQRVTACDNFFSSDKEVRCNGRYCDACIQRHYLEDPGEFSNLSSWICYRCTGRCTCAACKRRRKADEEGDDRIIEPEPRKRETRRYHDDIAVYDDDDFEPKKRQAVARPTPQAPRMVEKHPAAGMSALALLAEESLTSEFVPRAGLVSADALEVVHEHTEEIARLKQLCVLLQLQVSEISKQVGIAEKTE